MVSDVRIGIVGIGRLGMKHAENLAFRVRGARLHAACALEPDRVQSVCRHWGVPRGYTRFEELLSDKELDALFVASSSAEHCRQACAALDAESAIQGAIRFAPSSGGQSLDMSVHDIDLARWMLGAEATTIFADTRSFRQDELVRLPARRSA